MPELPIITIDRVIMRDFGTYGMLTSGDFRCFTVERPWLGNVPWVSCIPAGKYLASRGEFSRGRPPYPDLELHDVPDRDAIEMHAANLPEQLSGCIAPVEHLKFADKVIYGSNSKSTLVAVMDSFDTDDVWILIRERR